METKFFEGCSCLWEAKYRYLAVAKMVHPVNGKDPLKLFSCRLEYILLTTIPFFRFYQLPPSVQEDFTRFPDIIDKLIGWNLEVDMLGSWTWVKGENSEYRIELIKMGFIFEESINSWYLQAALACLVNRNPLSNDDLQTIHLQKTLEALCNGK